MVRLKVPEAIRMYSFQSAVARPTQTFRNLTKSGGANGWQLSKQVSDRKGRRKPMEQLCSVLSAKALNVHFSGRVTFTLHLTCLGIPCIWNRKWNGSVADWLITLFVLSSGCCWRPCARRQGLFLLSFSIEFIEREHKVHYRLTLECFHPLALSVCASKKRM